LSSGNSNLGDSLVNHGDGTYTYTAAAGEEIPLGTADTFGFTFRVRSHINLDTSDPDFETRFAIKMADTVYFRTDGGKAAVPLQKNQQKLPFIRNEFVQTGLFLR